MGIDYLEAAKNQILAIEGEHHVEEVNARMLTAIADVLVHIAMKDERTCRPIERHRCLSGTDCPAWECSVCGGEFEAYANYCSNCGAKVVKE